jgi:hypothetical protein
MFSICLNLFGDDTVSGAERIFTTIPSRTNRNFLGNSKIISDADRISLNKGNDK